MPFARPTTLLPAPRSAHWFGILIPGGILLVTLLLWHALRIQERAQTLNHVKTVADGLADHIGKSVESDTRALARMAARWEISGKPPRAYWEADAAHYVHDSPQYQAVEWIDPSLHIRWLMPLRGNEAALKMNLTAEKRRASALLTARDTRAITISRPVHLVQGGTGFLVYVPIFRQNRFEGFITGVFRLDRLFAALPAEMMQGYSLTVSENNVEVFRWQEADAAQNAVWERSTPIALRGVTWTLRIAPDSASLNAFRSPLPTLVLLMGTLTTLLVLALLFYVYRAHTAQEIMAAESARRFQSEAKVRTILESITDAFLTFDREWRFVSVNPEAERIMGRSHAELVGKIVWEEYPEAVETNWYREYHRALQDNVAVAFEVFNVGTQRWSDVRAYPSAEGQSVYFRDVTERRQALQALQESQRLIQGIADASPNILYLYDLAARRNIYTNREVATVLGYTQDGILRMGDVLLAIMHPDDMPRVMAHFEQFETTMPGAVCEVEYRMRHANGEWRWIRSRDTVYAYEGGKPLQIVGSAQDITNQKTFEEQIAEQMMYANEANIQLQIEQAALAEANARLEALATTDGLTGLKNHRAFQEKLADEYERAHRYNSPLSLLLLDVDYFKKFNDAFGHPAGDRVLKRVAAALQAAGRSSDFIARYGGEEFVILLPATDAESAREYGERIRAAIAGEAWERRAITVSIGGATLEALTESSAALVAEADQALYRSKAAGRNCVTHFGAEAILAAY